MSKYDIADYVVSNLQDPLSRVSGVGNFKVFGTQYAMRIWLDPYKLNSFALTPVDVTRRGASQNMQVSGGQLGGTPAPAAQQLNATMTEATLLRTPDEFGNILLKVDRTGRRCGCATSRASSSAPTTTVIEPLQRPAGVRDRRCSSRPARTRSRPPTRCKRQERRTRSRISRRAGGRVPVRHHAVREDFDPEVVKTLFEAIVLVFLVMYLFLQNLRATLIPTIAVPVVLLGTFGVLAAFGFYDQHTDDVRPGARDRTARRRRDRRRRERRARDVRGRAVAARGDAQGDGADHRRAGRRCARAVARCSCRWRSSAGRPA